MLPSNMLPRNLIPLIDVTFSTPTSDYKQLSELRQDTILPSMDQSKQWLRLIRSRFAAAIGVVLTGYVAALTLRSAFWQSPHHFHWLLPVDTILPSRATLLVNVAFYAWLVWLCIVLPRAARGKERVLVIGWALSLPLSLVQGLVRPSLAALIQDVRATSMAVAFFAVVAILIEGPGSGNSAPDSTVSE